MHVQEFALPRMAGSFARTRAGAASRLLSKKYGVTWKPSRSQY
ncbi:hypothetical protein [Streptomyces sp. NPDC001815]